ncbi:MAG TPA: hypothetical protein VKF37_06735 [Chloroflexota bacterium]|nr:hypothetical protein [Chloroflexota bacterium]
MSIWRPPVDVVQMIPHACGALVQTPRHHLQVVAQAQRVPQTLPVRF